MPAIVAWRRVLLVYVYFTSLSQQISTGLILPDSYQSECRGSHDGLSDRFASERERRYEWYREQYENCTHVTSNLEIVHLNIPNKPFDTSFLENIREVHGYVLIASNFIHKIQLTSLRIIRGLVKYTPATPDDETLITKEHRLNYSLYVAANGYARMPTEGLRELQLPALREILQGSVLFKNNRHLCYDGNKTIDWSYILHDGFEALYVDDEKVDACDQTTCDKACAAPRDPSRHLCWGPGPDLCQKITNLTCAEVCKGRCFGPGEGQCCDPECAGGCDGSGNRRCWACRLFDNDGNCEKSCPPYMVYQPEEHTWVPNPNVKYSYGTKCLDECPLHMYADRGACVSTCGPGHTEVEGICEECDEVCPRRCVGNTGNTGDIMGFVNEKNIAKKKKVPTATLR